MKDSVFMFHRNRFVLPALALATFLFSVFVVDSSRANVRAAEWRVPLAGNAYRTAPEPGRLGRRRANTVIWSEPEAVFSIFVHVDRPAALNLSLLARVSEGTATMKAQVGDQELPFSVNALEFSPLELGLVQVAEAGYVRIDVRGVELAGTTFAELQDLIVQSDTESLAVDYVRNNEGNMFYWGRRGPSVHLTYEVPKDRTLRFAYSEITVPQGQDPIGSYYMANGFGEGYFGIQVNSAEERRVLFSVWSPFSTDDPKSIPEDQRIEMLQRGPDVTIGEFGNEGSGGQSYLVYPWKAGVTYRFLTEVRPDGMGSTIYTSWFGDKQADEWRMIASFRRPKTDTHLRGFHSFLESFSPEYGFVGRLAHYGNVWVRDVEGEWHECTEAKFSVDPTGGQKHRLDYQGGAEGDRFYLQNCGFFSKTVDAGARFTRSSTSASRPSVDFLQQ